MWSLGASIFLADSTVLRNCSAEVSVHVQGTLWAVHMILYVVPVRWHFPPSCSTFSHWHAVRFVGER